MKVIKQKTILKTGEKLFFNWAGLLIVLSFWLVDSAFSQTSSEELSEEQSLIVELQAFSELSVSEYSKKILTYNKKMDEYLKKRELMCSGKYFPVEIKEDGQKIQKQRKKKLSKKERRLCIYLLLDFKVRYTTEMFKLRKKQLTLLHQEQKEQLSGIEKKVLTDLKKKASKYK